MVEVFWVAVFAYLGYRKWVEYKLAKLEVEDSKKDEELD